MTSVQTLPSGGSYQEIEEHQQNRFDHGVCMKVCTYASIAPHFTPEKPTVGKKHKKSPEHSLINLVCP